MAQSCTRGDAVCLDQGGSQSADVQSLAVHVKYFQSSASRSLAGIVKTSTCELHVTDMGDGGQLVTCVAQLTVCGGFFRCMSSGSEVNVRLVVGGIWWTRDTQSML